MPFRSATAESTSVRILLVDDFEPWRQAISSMLDAYHQLRIVGEAADGLEGVRKAEELQPDLILLDIRLPTLTGLEAASRVRQVAPSAKVIFLTQDTDVDVIREALSIGAGYVWKADAGHDLVAAMEAVLRGEKFVSQKFNYYDRICC